MSKNSKIRVLYIPSWYPSMKNPYAGSFIKDLAIDVSCQDIEIEVAAFHFSYRDFSLNKYECITQDHVTEHHFSGWALPKMNVITQKLWIDKCIKQLIKKVDIKQVDFIHAHDYISFFIGSELAKLYDKKLIGTIHHSDIMMDLVPIWRKKLLIPILSKMHKIFAPSQALKAGVLHYFGEYQIEVIPNYIDAKEIKKKQTLLDKPKKFISIGALEPLKNHELSIHLMKDQEAILDIYGDGPSRKILRSIINRNKLQQKVNLKGNIARKELLSILSEYDALISTSLYETFGLGIVEAMAAGLPVICLNDFGPSDYINENNGIYIDGPENPIDELTKRYKNYNPEAIRESVISKYEKGIVINKMRNIYREIISLCAE